MKKGFTFFTLIVATVLCLSFAAFGQRTTGDIQGTITDPNGAVVPGASVTVTGKSVGYSRTFQADDKGTFRAVGLPSGAYTVTVAAISGFVAQTKENVVVSANNVASADFTMAASASATVDVTGEATLIDTTSTRNETTILTREIDNLPKGTGFTSLLIVTR